VSVKKRLDMGSIESVALPSPQVAQSLRNDTIGSTLLARCAGM
jgi:hypothetical protein